MIEGLGLAARDCYAAMGAMPAELRLTGGAARSDGVAPHLSAAVNAPIRVSPRGGGGGGRGDDGGGGGRRLSSMDDCIADWVTPLLGEPEAPDAGGCPTLRPAVFCLYRWRRRQWRPSGTSLPQRAATSPVARIDTMQRGTKEHEMTETGLMDLFVIGGGINGAGIARDAAGRGL